MTTAKELDERIRLHLVQQLEASQQTLSHYDALPRCCRMVSDALIRETVGSATPRELGMVETSRDIWSCPTCNRRVLDES